MKTTINALSLLFAFLLSSLTFAQGWERVYEEQQFGFKNVKALSNGDFVCLKKDIYSNDYEVGIVDDNGDLIAGIPLEADFLIYGDYEDLIVNEDGTVTVVVFKYSLYTDVASKAYWFNIDPETAMINWTNIVDLPGAGDTFYKGRKIIGADADGYYLSAEYSTSNNSFTHPAAIRTDLLGNVEWANSYPNPNPSPTGNNANPLDIDLHPEGGLLILARPSFNEEYFEHVAFDGTVIYTNRFNIYSFSLSDYDLVEGQLLLEKIAVAEEGGYLVTGRIQPHTETNLGLIFHANELGEVDRTQEIGTLPSSISDFRELDNGKLLILSDQGFGQEDKLELRAFDSDWELLYETSSSVPFRLYGSEFEAVPDAGVIISGGAFLGQTNSDGFQTSNGYLLRLGENGQLYNSQIQGYVFQDLDEDCSDLVEMPLANWLIAFSDGYAHYALTDENGFYQRPINGGTYVTQVFPPNNYWSACPMPLAVSVPDEDTLTLSFPVQAAVECPNLWVDISAPFLRRCLPSVYTVSYCNMGTITAPDAYVEVELDEHLTYESSTLLPSEQEGNLFRFPVGDVGVGECGNFQITVVVNCEGIVFGQTHCSTAHIYPDSLCNVPSNWSGASLEATANCEGDSLAFTITNVGTAPMTINVNYLVIEDQVILLEGNEPPLDPDQSVDLTIAADGSTYRLEVEQEPNHPGNNNPTVTVEGCGSPPEDMSLGFVTQYWENDGDNFVSIDCQENIGSYDPNDKRVYPAGYGEEHFIDANEPLEYHIRFQNTGTDTAFKVVIKDYLVPELDITTVRVGAASHPYELSIQDDRSLVFTFDDILLVDSFANEPLSHGFVKFRVEQLPDLPNGTKINNFANIYFDFNGAIQTNFTRNTIGEDYVTSIFVFPDDAEGAARLLDVFPNPFADQTRIELKRADLWQKTRFLLYDVAGHLVREEVFTSQNLDFKRQRLNAGIYFYQLEIDGGIAENGKLVIQD